MDENDVLVQGTDYDVTKTQDKNTTFTFKGNYIGAVTKTYTVNEDKPSCTTDTDEPSCTTDTDEPSCTTDTDEPSGTTDTPPGRTDTEGRGNTGRAVHTGDTARTGLWASVLAFSGGVLTLLTGKKRRKEEKKR